MSRKPVVGDKVIIKEYKRTPAHWNWDGNMNMWMGKTVTVSEIGTTGFRIREDSRWWWSLEDIVKAEDVMISILPEELFTI